MAGQTCGHRAIGAANPVNLIVEAYHELDAYW